MGMLDKQGLADNTLFVFASDNGPVLAIDGGDAAPYRDGKWTDSADHPEIVADLRRRMDAATRDLEANSRPIGRLPDAPSPTTESNAKKRNR